MKKKKFTKLVGTLLTEERHKLLVEVTENAEISVSEYVRAIIEDKLNKIQGKGEG